MPGQAVDQILGRRPIQLLAIDGQHQYPFGLLQERQGGGHRPGRLDAAVPGDRHRAADGLGQAGRQHQHRPAGIEQQAFQHIDAVFQVVGLGPGRHGQVMHPAFNAIAIIEAAQGLMPSRRGRRPPRRAIHHLDPGVLDHGIKHGAHRLDPLLGDFLSVFRYLHQ